MDLLKWLLLFVGALFVVPTWCQDDEGEPEPEDEADEGLEQDALTSEQIRTMHSKFDLNGDGKASLHEVLEFSSIARMEIAKKDIHTILDEMDLNRDQKLSLEELLKDVEAQAEGADEEEMKEMAGRKELETNKFKAADTDGDGLLDIKELPALFYPEIHEGVLALTVEATLKSKDKNGDGKLTMKEFWEGDAIDGEEEIAVADEEKEDFAKLDKNADGFLDLSELKDWESGRFHTEGAMKSMFETADADSDMHLSADELDNAREQIAGTDAQYHLMEWAEHHEL